VTSSNISRKKFLQIETIEKLFEVKTMLKNRMAWLCATLRRMFWMALTMILFLKILHQEMLEEFFLQSTEAPLFHLR
jgi:hypothetical protein